MEKRTVAVFGLGVLGQVIAQLAKLCGARVYMFVPRSIQPDKIDLCP
jgi:threonine dehydrogenase-like Zn-dependent dehydrogenase